ncbi:hypothetical protein MJG53_000397 [Ovis ammon polii x Ovis aries]|nr:hypothetical protein MJG53_000397 [Ovis ammon polii x Ovis aries]
MRDPFAACSGENPGRSRRIARRGALHRKAEDRLRPWLHFGQLFGNPRGKATDPMIDAMASVTLLLQLGRERIPGIPVASQEEAPSTGKGKNSRRSRRISRGGALHRKGERNSRVVPPFQESPRCDSPFQRNLFSLHCLDVQAEDRLPQRVHVGQPCGKASWERLVGKTRGKTIDPLIHAAECVTLLLPLWRKAQVHARIRDED